jgi:MarR family transcriptional regulator for hemolysin
MNRVVSEQKIAQQLVQLSRRWRLLGDQALAGLGLSDATGWCLLYLSRLGPDARQSDLARTVGVREASLVRTLVRLETMGFIERSPNPNDGRANVMKLTDRGQALVQQIENLLGELRHHVLGDISDADIETLARVCGAMNDRFAERHV